MRRFSPLTSPLARAHQEACRIGRPAHQPKVIGFRTLLYGRRAFRLPVISVLNDRELGRCRHALAQRVVGGTLEVQIPWADGNPFFRKAAPEKSAATPNPNP